MSRSVRGEFEIITQIKERCQASPVVQLGIGDDCAILQLPPGELLLSTTDMLIESVHFRRDWTGLLSLGRKSAAVNLSDLAAMGATPRALFGPRYTGRSDCGRYRSLLRVSGGLPRQRAVLAGGDTSSSQAGLSICVTALGSAPATEVVRRSGAKPGDGLYVTGALGDSSLALQWLGEGRALPPELLNRHLEPTARVKAGRALARSGIATAMIDVSDGLLADLGHILKASLVGACIQVDRLPLSSALRATGDEDSRLFDRALTGGEDYELLFTATPESEGKIARIASENSLPITRIGTISMAAEEFVLEYNGNMYPLPLHRGYKHFSDGT